MLDAVQLAWWSLRYCDARELACALWGRCVGRTHSLDVCVFAPQHAAQHFRRHQVLTSSLHCANMLRQAGALLSRGCCAMAVCEVAPSSTTSTSAPAAAALRAASDAWGAWLRPASSTSGVASCSGRSLHTSAPASHGHSDADEGKETCVVFM